MAHLEQQHPGDRENSLYASVELSLRRLPTQSREQVPALAVCHGGIHLWIMSELTGLETHEVRRLGAELIQVGLAEDMGDGHLRLDPGLAPYLLGELATAETDVLRRRWAEAMAELTQSLADEQFEDVQLANRLTILELPNLLGMLDWFQDHLPPEQLVDLAAAVEQLVSRLGRPQALARATRVRQQAAQKLGDSSRDRYRAKSVDIAQLLRQGDLAAANTATRQLLDHAVVAGENAYPEAAYDLAMAYSYRGRVLQTDGAAEAALVPLAEAQRRFELLADAGSKDAEYMVASTINEIGNCLADLGRFDQAAEAYEETIRRNLGHEKRRTVAVARAQLGTVRLRQKRYEEALTAYVNARDTYEALGEPVGVATAWHLIGMAYQDAGHFEDSEQAYRQALAISVRENDAHGQATTLAELGSLYNRMDRDEEAVILTRQAVEIYLSIGDTAGEGKARYQLARRLLGLRRYEEARPEIERVIESDKRYGHTAEPWKTWATLNDLERATGHIQEAQAARSRAIAAYLAYRRDGGDSQSNQIQYFSLVAKAILENTQDQAAHELNDFLGPDDPSPLTALIRQLQSILAGDRDPGLPADIELGYMNAAELQLLLDTLDQAKPDRIQE